MRVGLILLGTLAALALMGGGIFPWTLQVTAAVLLLACVFAVRAGTGPNRGLAWAAAALVALLVLSVVPLPAAVATHLPDPRGTQNLRAAGAVQGLAELKLGSDGQPWFSLTRNRAGTLRAILLIVAAFAAAALASRLGPSRRRDFLRGLVALGVALAVAGYLSQWVWPQGKRIWWTFDVARGSPVACFVNRNHFGGFVAMLCPVAFVLAADAVRGGRRLESLATVGAAAVLVLACLMSLSRGAWIALAAGMSVTVVLQETMRFDRRRLPVLAASVALAALVAGAIAVGAPEHFKERIRTLRQLPSTESAQTRFQEWRDGLRVLPHYAWIGAGANAFRSVYPGYRLSTARAHADFSENEYIQIPIEGGLLGVGAIAVLAWRVRRRWRDAAREGEGTEDAVPLAVLGALTVVAVHALFDFALRIPLYALVVAALTGLMLTPPKTAAAAPDPRRGGYNRLALAGLGIVLAVAVFGRSSVHTRDAPDEVARASLPEARSMLIWSPTDWQGWYRLGALVLENRPVNGLPLAETCFKMAADYDPQYYVLWNRLCLVRLGLGDRAGARDAYRRLKSLRSWVSIPEMEAEPSRPGAP